MAINPQGLMQRLSPLASLDFGAMAKAGMAREQLELTRAQLEETKRRNREDENLRRIAEAGEMRRAEMMIQRQRDADAAEAERLRDTERRKLYGEAMKYREAGDIEGIEALIPSMQAAGMNVDRLGDDGSGLPAYQIDWDGKAAADAESARAAQAAPYEVPAGAYGSMEEAAGAPAPESAVQSLSRLGGLGYPSLSERGNLDSAGIGSSDDIDASGQSVAERVAATYGTPGEKSATRGPDAPDLMGAVPKNVLDFGAMNQQAARRLDPALGALQRSYTEPFQDSVGDTNAAARAMGLPATATLELANRLRAGPNAAIEGELDREDRRRAKEKEDMPKPLTRRDILALSKGGSDQAKEMYDNRGIDDTFVRSAGAQAIVDILEDDDPNNDMAIAFELPNMLGSRGAQSNKDLAVALGLDAMSTVDQIKEYLTRIVEGGFTELRKESLIGIIRNKMEKDDELIYEFLDAIDEAAKLTTDPDVRSGLEKYAVGNVPKDYRDAWAEARGELGAEAGSPPPPSGGEPMPTAPGGRRMREIQPTAGSMRDDDDFMNAIHDEAEKAGLDATEILPLIAAESGGDPRARNRKGSSARGLIQFLDSTAQSYGFKDSAEFASLTRAQQAPVIVQYLKDKGVTADHDRGDIYVAIAAPDALDRADEHVVYRSGTDEYDKNTTWDLDGDGEITRGELYRWGWGERPSTGGRRGATSVERGSKAQERVTRMRQEMGVEPPGELDSEVLDILR